MKNFLKKIIQHKLRLLARLYLWKFKPKVIVIAGTTNRHWMKEAAISAIKNKNLKVRGNKKNFNAELGLPLSVLGLEIKTNDESKTSRWLKILWRGFVLIFDKTRKIDFLVLELAIDRPRDMDYLLSIVQPEIAIFTTITMIYPENFENLDQIAREYKKLVKSLPEKGLAIINADDERIVKLKDSARAEVITYGIRPVKSAGGGAASPLFNRVENKNADYSAQEIKKTIDGQEFEMYNKNSEKIFLKINRFGRHHICAKIVEEIIDKSL